MMSVKYFASAAVAIAGGDDDIDVFTDTPKHVHLHQPGERMRTGMVYAGISPDTHQPIYTTPEDAPLTHTFNGAAEYAMQLNAENYLGYHDWRVPTNSELNVLFNNRAVISGFHFRTQQTSQACTGWYWSSTALDEAGAWAQGFSSGDQYRSTKSNPSNLRCVRG